MQISYWLHLHNMIMKMLSAHKSGMIFNGENELKRPRVGWRKPDPGDWQKLNLYNKPDRWGQHINCKQALMKGGIKTFILHYQQIFWDCCTISKIRILFCTEPLIVDSLPLTCSSVWTSYLGNKGQFCYWLLNCMCSL